MQRVLYSNTVSTHGSLAHRGLVCPAMQCKGVNVSAVDGATRCFPHPSPTTPFCFHSGTSNYPQLSEGPHSSTEDVDAALSPHMHRYSLSDPAGHVREHIPRPSIRLLCCTSPLSSHCSIQWLALWLLAAYERCRQTTPSTAADLQHLRYQRRKTTAAASHIQAIQAAYTEPRSYIVLFIAINSCTTTNTNISSTTTVR